MTVLENGVDAMPVRIKPEVHDNLVPQPAPQPPPPPLASAANGTSAASRQPQASGQPQRGPNTSQASTNPSGAPGTAPSGANGVGKEKEAAQTISEDAIDYDSIRGVFGWATLDGVNVPYIIRKFRKFVAVRIVEKKMLSKYPNSFPDELGKKDPLISYFVTEAEAKLLNEINTIHCSYEYGHQPFSTKDLIVDLAEFEEFYTVVKKTFPDDVLATMAAEETASSQVDDKKLELSKVCGWMQINNTVTPYIVRSSGKFVPLSVILYAAQLLTKDHVEGYLPTEEECTLLNSTCRGAGFDFSFGKNTKLIHISEVVRRCQVRIFELPFENPLQHAQYIDTLQQVEAAGSQPPMGPPPAPGMQGSMSLPYQSKPILSEGPPNFNPFTGYNPLMSAAPSSVPPRHGLAHPTASLVRTETAPVFFPPAPPSSVHRGVHANNGGALVSQTSGMVSGHQRHSPSAMGPPQVGSAGGSPISQPSRFPAQFMHGGVPGRLPYPDPASSPSGRLPPPYMPPHAHLPQRPGHPPMSAHSGHGGHLPHHYMQAQPHLTGQQNEMMARGMGPVPRRGVVPLAGFPPPAGFPGALHPHMGMPPMQNHCPPRPRAQGPAQHQPPNQRSSPAPRSSRNASPGSMGVLPHPSSAANPPPPVFPGQRPVFQPQSGVFPVQLSPAANANKDSSGNAPGVDPAAASVLNKPAPDEHLKLVADIKPVMSHGKSISCMRRDSPGRKGNFCLVEAVAKLYFPRCSLAEFVNALRNVLQISLPVCTEAEAKAFIHFYNLPVTSLNDNHLITLEDLNNYFPQIYYMFRTSSVDHHNSQLVNQQTATSTRRSSGTEGTTRIASPSAPITVVLNNNNTAEVIDVDSVAPSPSNDRKRPGDGADGAPGGKVQRSGDEVDGPSSRIKKAGTIDNVVTPNKSSTKQPANSSQVIVID